MTDTPATTERRAGKWRWILFGSLALNLLLIGMMTGAMMRQGGARQMMAAQGPFNVISYMADLPKSRREEIRNALTMRPRDLKGVRDQVARAREGLLSALTAEPFDIAQFKAANDRLVAAEHHQRGTVREIVNEIVARLTPEERKAYPAWRVKHMRQRGRSESMDQDRDTTEPKK
jgi:uncharacterized membrane protein